MKKIFVLMVITATFIMTGCGNSSKEKKGDTGDMKVKLEKLKKEKNDLDAEIRKLEEQIEKANPNAANVAKLVSADSVRVQEFTHFIELQGKIDADNIVYVTPRGMPAQVKALYVKRGDVVRKGQLLAKLDDAVMLQQVDGLKTQLAYAENIYNRQKNLWDQGIGTEVQLITAKNNVDALKKQIATLNETWNTSFVYAPVSGIADEVNIKPGEIFAGGSNQIRIVNTYTLKMVTEVPENYISRVKKGDQVEVVVPETGRPAFKSTISVIGASVNPTTRSFITEAKLPADPFLKPNQLATLKILDYKAKAALVVPINVVQTDEKGKYVYVIEKTGNKMVARKKPVTVGEAYNGNIEIKNGLMGGDAVITEGYQTVYDGQTVTTTTQI
ncbi:MAG TPA: efflux RND transporter periplasmic adaptor subunit [Chitinophagaceae bacterium]|nr:efflux RND transporter periplasmic adaptor subunit [Chitinophagaceae bacterium]